MYCENCGHPLRDGDLFCTKCGAPIERKNIGGRNVNMNTGEHGSAPAPAEKPKSRRKGLIVALSVAGGVCVLGLLVWLMLSFFVLKPHIMPVATVSVSEETIATVSESEAATEAPSEKPTEKSTEKPTEAPFSISADELEEEIAKIRVYYYTPGGDDVQKTVESGTDGWRYARDYRFHSGKLVFAFIFDGTEEHRLYFKDDHMIRYIDEEHTTYDYPDTAPFSDWEKRALEEAYSLMPEGAPNDASDSGWLGTWENAGGESLEITEVFDTGLTLIFHKLTQQGEKIGVDYQMEFDNADKTVASEIGGAEDHGGWEYTFTLGDGFITVSSRYPDQIYYKK